MRQTRKFQYTLRENWLPLGHARELQTISRVLDDNPRVAELVLQDLRAARRDPKASCGAEGLSAEQVLRILLVKQMNRFSYRTLAFHLADSSTYRTFCCLGLVDKLPSKSALHANLKALQAATLEQIHRVVLGAAQREKIETGRTVRADCTVVETNIHKPWDSELLWDSVRVLTRHLTRTCDLLGLKRATFANRSLRAKRRRQEIAHAKTPAARRSAYRDLLTLAQEVYGHGLTARDLLRAHAGDEGLDPVQALCLQALARGFDHYLPLVHQAVEQTRRRVLQGESVPVAEKIVSLFEEHTDILRKDRRDTLYGHKICLTGGASSMILDCKVLRGNPADSTLAKALVERQVQVFTRPPRQVVFDGGFASQANVREIKALGVRDVAFSKRCGLEISAMAKSLWVYQRLRDFRAGIEGNISFLKRIFGLDRCTWKSWSSFQSYVWGSILSFNLLVLARHLLH